MAELIGNIHEARVAYIQTIILADGIFPVLEAVRDAMRNVYSQAGDTRLAADANFMSAVRDVLAPVRDLVKL